MTLTPVLHETQARPTSVWGDGFHEDGWRDLAAVQSWDELEPDQYVRFHPRLVATRGALPDVLRARLAARVAGLGHGSGRRRAWPAPLRRWLGLAEPSPATGDGTALAFLKDVLERIERGDQGSVDGTQTAWFAFLTGIHAAYIWPIAAVSHERDTTAGWLGILAGGRAAYMPAEVADYLADIIVREGGRAVVRDAQMAQLAAASRVDVEALRAAAIRRQDGQPVVVRGSHGTRGRAVASHPGLSATWKTRQPLHAQPL